MSTPNPVSGSSPNPVSLSTSIPVSVSTPVLFPSSIHDQLKAYHSRMTTQWAPTTHWAPTCDAANNQAPTPAVHSPASSLFTSLHLTPPSPNPTRLPLPPTSPSPPPPGTTKPHHAKLPSIIPASIPELPFPIPSFHSIRPHRHSRNPKPKSCFPPVRHPSALLPHALTHAPQPCPDPTIYDLA